MLQRIVLMHFLSSLISIKSTLWLITFKFYMYKQYYLNFIYIGKSKWILWVTSNEEKINLLMEIVEKKRELMIFKIKARKKKIFKFYDDIYHSLLSWGLNKLIKKYQNLEIMKEKDTNE